MKINEIITETKVTVTQVAVDDDSNNDGIPDSHRSATPGLRSHKELNNSDPYYPWRFGALFLSGAGAPDGKYEHQPVKDGPNGQSLITAAYSEGERAILDQAAKAFGPEATDYIKLSPDGSTETDSVHKVSPHRRVGAIVLIKKKK
jgi:hypothetical protein